MFYNIEDMPKLYCGLLCNKVACIWLKKLYPKNIGAMEGGLDELNYIGEYYPYAGEQS